MSRYIDADSLKKRMLAVFEDDGIGVVLNGYWSSKLVREIIDEQPTADVVEVVRCKDCKFRKIEFGWNGKKYKMCANTDYPTDDDAYCSYAERREDDE